MKCYYDILNIDKLATSDNIKKAYYKLSLKWHPDKNPDNIGEATEIFQEIQRAYKVLSNSQERAWYDKNRERFLSMKFNSENELYDLINNIIYQGFGDDSNGFYAVHKNIFSILIEREEEACRIRGEIFEEIPQFGNSTSNYKEIVGTFYSFWESFNTKMSFHWKNKHDINLSYPRDIRRAMEKENSEERNTARKEYNKTIQSLIATLKSRDPRIKLWKEHLNNKAKDNEKKAAKMAQKAWEKSRQNMPLKQDFPSFGDISVEELEEKLNSLEMEHGKTGIEFDEQSEEFYCVACNKYFKSLAAFNNHEKSKNHNKNLANLRKQILMEDQQLFADIINDDKTSDKVSEDDRESTKIDQNISLSDIETPVSSKDILEKDELVFNKVVTENNDIVINDVKKEKKRRRKPKSEMIPEVSGSTIDINAASELICERCGSEFSTRNKLFQHIKSSGHGTIKSTVGKSKSSSKVKTKK